MYNILYIIYLLFNNLSIKLCILDSEIMELKGTTRNNNNIEVIKYKI